MKKIDKLIINSPYEEPRLYWEYLRDTREFVLQEGRRPAGYVVASESSKSFDYPGTFIEIELVNIIRPRIKKWREQCYPGVTGITKRLLQHWQNPEERKDRRFFFCQSIIELLFHYFDSSLASLKMLLRLYFRSCLFVPIHG
jgi:type III restriction enzyme